MSEAGGTRSGPLPDGSSADSMGIQATTRQGHDRTQEAAGSEQGHMLGRDGLVFSSIDEFEFLPASHLALPMRTATLPGTAQHHTSPGDELSPRLSVRRASEPVSPSSAVTAKPALDTSFDQLSLGPASSAMHAGQGRLSLPIPPGTLRTPGSGTAGPATPASSTTSRSMTPQLSFDELDPVKGGGAAGGVLRGGAAACESPTALKHAQPSAAATGGASHSDTGSDADVDCSGHDSTPPGTQTRHGLPLRKEEHLGGGALYALQGARLWLAPNQCKVPVDRQARSGRGTAWIQEGVAEEGKVEPVASDMTPEQEDQLETLSRGSWDYLEEEGKRMVRARIRYEGDARRYQHLIKPYPRPFPAIAATAIRGARYMHVSPPYGPTDLVKLLDEMDEYYAPDAGSGAGNAQEDWRPKILFEPTPPSCVPEQMEWLEKCCSRIHILSPNHEELLCLFSREILPLSDARLPGTLENIMWYLLNLGIGPEGEGAIIVRCGRMGSVVGSRAKGIVWLPAFWTGEEEGRVLDVTGAGNAFLGGAIAGLQASNDDPVEAALYGTISASFVVEQKGLPRRTADAARLPDSTYSEEEWNGDLPSRRLKELRTRCGL